MLGKEYHFPLEDRIEVIKNSRDVKTLIPFSINNAENEKNGEQPSQEQVFEIMKKITSRVPDLSLNIDLGGWISSEKITLPIFEIVKIPSQRSKVLQIARLLR